MSVDTAIHYIVRREGADSQFVYVEDAIAEAQKRLKDYPHYKYCVFSADRLVSTVAAPAEVKQLFYDWDINYKKPVQQEPYTPTDPVPAISGLKWATLQPSF